MWWSDKLTELQVRLGAPELAAYAVSLFIGAFILANVALILALLLIWITRKVISRIQDRIGPNRSGPYGLFQTVADALKLLSKEDIRPYSADWLAWYMAPILTVFGVILSVAVFPIAPGLTGANLSIGALYLVALGSVGIMAALMAGWASNNKYALLAGFRVVAQLLSYEIPMVLAMFAPVLLTYSMSLDDITRGQSFHIFGFNLGIGWYIFTVPGAALIFFIASLAEGEQTPFDLLEAESELIAGFHIEYSGMKFAMIFLAQFLNSFFLGVVAVILFLGGYQGPGVDLPYIGIFLGLFYFLFKSFAMYVVLQWIKGTFPRVRIDQMMSFAWKVLVPLVLGLILWQMIAQKLPIGGFGQWIVILAGNLLVVGTVFGVLEGYFKREQVRTKRVFEPTSLIGTMQPVSPSGDS